MEFSRLILITIFASFNLFAGRFQPEVLPTCMDKQLKLPLSNAKVLNWKENTPNLFMARALVSGTFIQSYPDRNGHDHFSISIGPGSTDTIEVVYNQCFGALPKAMNVGDRVAACGDYITSNKDAKYPASPDKAIIHWVHKSDSVKTHDSGYVVINGVVYGQGADACGGHGNGFGAGSLRGRLD